MSDLIGHDHDLVVRHDIAASSDLDARAAEALTALVKRCCQELRREAMPIGLRLYAERPGTVIDRLDVYWKAWQGLVPPEDAKHAETDRPINPAPL
ncbi:hypothetical protein [Azospirillum brasilense]|uniref:Uncharacterized protein n=1 Tax=Azospirillum brasilense TaxID=192 RepID=A0A235HBE3_AZOBR|nr:hypothetical protein [Azospirillum brasilense]OYD82827.1 hypothetical protein CHT98_18175 [Azospirillum brasilense]